MDSQERREKSDQRFGVVQPVGSDASTYSDLPPDLQPIALRYAAYSMPCPTPQDTDALVNFLLAKTTVALPATTKSLDTCRDIWQLARARVVGVFAVARWRMRLLGPWFWLTSVVLLVIEAFWATNAPGDIEPLVLLAPLTGVLSLAYATRPSPHGMRAVEISCPITAIEVKAGLAMAIISFDCTLGLVATLLLTLLHWAPFVALLTAWLAPLLLLTGISLPVALRWGPLPAATVGISPWLLLAMLALFFPHGIVVNIFDVAPNTPILMMRLAALFLGVLLLALTTVRSTSSRAGQSLR